MIDIIRFNDDNHAERVWVNKKYVGDTSNIESILINTIMVVGGNSEEENKQITTTEVYVCDDFDDMDEEIVDTIWEWFNLVLDMTDEQLELVHNKDWVSLYNNIEDNMNELKELSGGEE